MRLSRHIFNCYKYRSTEPKRVVEGIRNPKALPTTSRTEPRARRNTAYPDHKLDIVSALCSKNWETTQENIRSRPVTSVFLPLAVRQMPIPQGMCGETVSQSVGACAALGLILVHHRPTIRQWSRFSRVSCIRTSELNGGLHYSATYEDPSACGSIV